MSFYNTGNPVPSIDPRDLDDNAKHIDDIVNSTFPTFVDRLGVTRKTLSGIETDADSILLRSDLSNATLTNKGASLVGYRGRTVLSRLDDSVNVKDYGARGLGDSFDDSAAFTAAFAVAASTGKPVFIPDCAVHYNVGDVSVPFGVSIIGSCRRPYTATALASFSAIGGAIVKKTGATDLFKWSGRHVLQGVVMFGRDKAGPCFRSATGSQFVDVRLLFCGIYGFSSGIGNSQYIGGVEAIGCNISGNTNGVDRIIDSKIIGGYVNANDNAGVSCGTGANDNTFIGVKNEWNGGDNYIFFGSVNNVVLGGVTDRAGNNNFNIGSAAQVSITGGMVRRGGRNGGSTYNILVQDATKVVISSLNTASGPDDGGTGPTTPATNIRLGGAVGQLTMTGVDGTGGTTTALSIAAATTFTTLSIRDCAGIADRFDRSGDCQGTVTIPAVSTVNLAVKLIPIPTFGGSVHRVVVHARNTNSGGDIFGSAILLAQREGASASTITPLLDWASGSFGVVGTETISVSLTSLSTDGSTANLALKSTHATDTFSVNCIISRMIGG